MHCLLSHFFLIKYLMRDKHIMYMETLLGYRRKIRVHDRNKDWFSNLCERQFDLNIVTQLKDDFRVKRNFFQIIIIPYYLSCSATAWHNSVSDVCLGKLVSSYQSNTWNQWKSKTRVTSCVLRVQITSDEFKFTSYEFRSTSYKTKSTNCKIKSTSQEVKSTS